MTERASHEVPVLGFIIPWAGGMIASKFPLTPLGICAVVIIAFLTVIAQERACK